MDPISDLQAALDQTGPILAATSADQFGLPTPCTDWDVEALVEHTVGIVKILRDAVAEGSATEPDTTELDDAAAALAEFQSIGAEALALWSERQLDQVVDLPWGSTPGEVAVKLMATDLTVHGWDLATATGQSPSWNQDLAADGLEFTQGMMAKNSQARSRAFGPEVLVAADADSMSKLVGFLGREP